VISGFWFDKPAILIRADSDFHHITGSVARDWAGRQRFAHLNANPPGLLRDYLFWFFQSPRAKTYGDPIFPDRLSADWPRMVWNYERLER